MAETRRSPSPRSRSASRPTFSPAGTSSPQRSSTTAILRGHLIPFFGHLELAQSSRATSTPTSLPRPRSCPPRRSQPARPAGLMFKVAQRWRLMQRSPVEEVDAPRADTAEMYVLTEAEIARLLTAYHQLEADPPEGTTGRRVAAGATARRHGARHRPPPWRVARSPLARRSTPRRRLTVREAFVRGAFQTPKSRKSRTFELGPLIVHALDEQCEDTATGRTLISCSATARSARRSTPRSCPERTCARRSLRPGSSNRSGLFHDLRHTAITHDAAAGNPQAYVQMKAGHSQGAITERYIHAAP